MVESGAARRRSGRDRPLVRVAWPRGCMAQGIHARFQDHALTHAAAMPRIASELPPTVEPAIRTIAMPSDTNPAGDIFGGWLLAQMDLAAGNVAARHARGRCATIAIDKIAFLQPVKVGDEVTVYAELMSTGRTSMRFEVSAWRRRRDGEDVHKVTGAIFTFVALDLDGKPREIRPMVR